MSGGLEVLGGISALSTLLDTCIKVYDSAQSDAKLPESFEIVRRQLPVILYTLKKCFDVLEQRRDSMPLDVWNALEEIVDACIESALKLRRIFEEVTLGEKDTWEKRYAKAIRKLGKGSKIEELMATLTQDVQLLVNHDRVNSATPEQNVELEHIVKEMKSVRSSTPEEEHSALASNSDGGTQASNANIRTKHSHSVTIRKEDFRFRGPVGIYLGQAPCISPELFVGRDYELDEIAKFLHPDHKAQKQRRLVLCGVGGIGKTQLAIAYTESSRGSYSSVLWFNAASEATLKDSFRSTSSIIFDVEDSGVLEEKEAVRRVHQWLCSPGNTGWLLIFDNYDDPSEFRIDYYYPPSSHGAIIITARQPDPVAGALLYIKPLRNIEDSLAILQTRSKRENIQSDPYARVLAERLEGLPLALATAGACLSQNAWTFERYLQEFEKRSIEDHGRHQSDVVSNPPSIFSLQSVQSTALTTDTNLTADEMWTAIDELVGIFMNDKEMASMYREAVFERRITTVRFVRNFRRLIKRFAVHLKEEAREAIDLDLANLVSSRAGLVADKIGSKLEQQYSQPDTQSTQLQGIQMKDETNADLTEELHDASSDDERENVPEQAVDVKFAALVSHGRSFIEESAAFQKLREEFKNFIIPPRLNGGLEAEPFLEAKSEVERWIHYVSSRSLGCVAPGWAMRVCKAPKRFLSRIGLLEESISKNHHRFRWTNRHGKKLYDDYVEHEPGALQALQEYLNATTVPTKAVPSSNQGHTSSRAAFQYTPNPRSLSAAIPPSIDITDGSTKAPNKVQTSCTQQDTEMGNSLIRPLLLLSCIERRGRPIKLHQELVTHVTDDRELFHTLRRVYYGQRRKFESFWSLRTLHSIHFMKFGYGGHGLIDVRCHPEPCEPGKPCACIPPADRVSPQSEEYACQPIPSKLSPPYGPRLMMDLFKDPDSRKPRADSILQQLPKRMSTELDLDEAEMMEAWGIFYREDWDWMRIWIVLGIAFFPPSLLFGILWGIMRQDIQGAFGVASWWMTSATIAVGIVGTCT